MTKIMEPSQPTDALQFVPMRPKTQPSAKLAKLIEDASAKAKCDLANRLNS